jgi:hypothetical protein
MFITQKHISRRTVLKGMGVTVALPFLEAMVPARTVFAKAAPTRIRLACIEMVHGSAGSTVFGIKKNMWAPAAVGREFDLTPSSLLPLDPLRDHITIVSNTDVRNAEAFTAPEIGGDHFRSSAVFLTQTHPRQTQGSDVKAGTSLDQYSRRSSARIRRFRRCSCASRTWISRAAAPTATRAPTPIRSAGPPPTIRCR